MMNILVTGAKGFVGKNLCENLKNIRDGKHRTHPELSIGRYLNMILTPIRYFWTNIVLRLILFQPCGCESSAECR